VNESAEKKESFKGTTQGLRGVDSTNKTPKKEVCSFPGRKRTNKSAIQPRSVDGEDHNYWRVLSIMRGSTDGLEVTTS